MRVRIHRGTKEIGGTCTEVEARGKAHRVRCRPPARRSRRWPRRPASARRRVPDSGRQPARSDHFSPASGSLWSRQAHTARGSHLHRARRSRHPDGCQRIRAQRPRFPESALPVTRIPARTLDHSELPPIWWTTAPSTRMACSSRPTAGGSTTPETFARTDASPAFSKP